MNKTLLSEVHRLGGDPADEVWRWLLTTGPHGPSFTWSQAKSEPPGYVGLEHLREIIAERADQDSEFRTRASTIAQQALTSDRPVVVRRALQVAGALALLNAIPKVEELMGHPNLNVAADARACLFVLREHRR
jgi:hypothetical protein